MSLLKTSLIKFAGPRRSGNFFGFRRIQKPVRPAENKHSPARRPSKKKKKTSCTSDIFNANVK